MFHSDVQEAVEVVEEPKNSTLLAIIFYARYTVLKVAEHSFQVPRPNSPLLLNYLCFGARSLQESGLTTEVFIFAFGWGVCCCHGNGAG